MIKMHDKKGIFGKYKGTEYEIIFNENDKPLIITRDIKKTDNKFIDEYNSGLYSKRIFAFSLSDCYRIKLEVKYQNDIFDLGGEDEESYYVGTSNTDLAEKHGIDRSDKMRYDSWIPKNQCQIIEIRTDINLGNMYESNETRRIITEDK